MTEHPGLISAFSARSALCLTVEKTVDMDATPRYSGWASTTATSLAELSCSSKLVFPRCMAHMSPGSQHTHVAWAIFKAPAATPRAPPAVVGGRDRSGFQQL